MTEFDRIPKEVFKEAEKLGVTEDDILFAAHADKNPEGVLCDNWVLVTEEEILMIGGIQLVVPKEGAKWNDSKKLTVKYGNISVDRLERAPLSDFKTEKQKASLLQERLFSLQKVKLFKSSFSASFFKLLSSSFCIVL